MPFRARFSILLAFALALAACSGAPKSGLVVSPSGSPPPVVRTIPGWLTTADGSHRLVPFEASEITLGSGQGADVVVDTSQHFQPFAGYGASVTDATAWLLMHELDAASRSQLLQELFGLGGALGLDVARISIGASDFSRSHYTFADTPGLPDADIAPARADLIPALLEIRSINPGLSVIASPWSAPAWMKTSGSLIKGRLDPAHYADFAHYLVSYVSEMQAAGIPIDMLTIQNEPHFEPEDYPGMRVEPAERAAFVGEHLGPLMDRENPQTRLLDWDHNWNEPDSPLSVLADTRASPFVDGVAWHCYAGDVSAQTLVHERFPDKEAWFTECSAGDWSGSWTEAFQWSARNLVIGAPRNWARGVLMWNLALDQNNGPHLGGCGTCRGLVTIDTQTGAISREPEYYAFAHGSRFLPADPVRVDSTTAASSIDAVAFLGRRDGALTMLVFNGKPGDEGLTFIIDGRAYRALMPSGALATFVIAAAGG
ncbi:MAG: hypothetical protein APF78_01560 [Sphingomonadales bacterium BRH_c3]|nr:MAG: hypothetical protein APF78_01560 [Sphingomonadales bacterium BRH_c3]